MKNTFGTCVSVTLFGESHGPYIGAVLDGLSPGVPVDEDYIARELEKRRPAGRISTARVESDKFEIISGVFEGKTAGTPVTVIIPNENTKSGDYSRGLPRPGHADYTGYAKYHGFEDYRGGGHFSGRITAALVAVGAIAKSALRSRGIMIGTHIARCADVADAEFSDITREIEALDKKTFAVLDISAGERMRERIEAAANGGDSVGGVLETAIAGVPVGVGEPWFDTLEGVLAHAVFSVPAVKGIEFGLGFACAGMRGSEVNDPIAARDGRIVTETNNNGGINGGISNGMPIIFRTAVKPTPSIYKPQRTVDLLKNENTVLELHGRHDPAIVHRARAVVDAAAALAVADMLEMRYGEDYFGGDA